MYRENRVGEGVLVHVLGGLDEDGAFPEAVRAGDLCRARSTDRHALCGLLVMRRGLGRAGSGGRGGGGGACPLLLHHLHLVLPRQLELGAYPALEEADHGFLVVVG